MVEDHELFPALDRKGAELFPVKVFLLKPMNARWWYSNQYDEELLRKPEAAIMTLKLSY